ncbi:MAG: hypothetical protein KDI64_09015 [Candidatus Accumulibacter sp.]|nr:hypothetical protein [Accumulibacter sp.]
MFARPVLIDECVIDLAEGFPDGLLVGVAGNALHLRVSTINTDGNLSRE